MAITGYQYPIPQNGIMYGVALEILSSITISDVYDDCGIYLQTPDGEQFPLLTIGSISLTENKLTVIEKLFDQPFICRSDCTLSIVSTGLPQQVTITPSWLLGVTDYGQDKTA